MNNEQNEAIEGIREVISGILDGQGAAVLTTTSESGQPHATWMATICSEDFREIVTITSPDSEKVANLQANDAVEWMFTREDMMRVAYLRGRAEIVDDPVEVKQWWGQLPDKGRAFFLSHYNTGVGFSIIKTKVSSCVYCLPMEFRKIEVGVDALSDALV